MRATLSLSLRTLALLLVATMGTGQSTSTGDQPTTSAHIKGPDGLEGWTIDRPLPDRPNETFPTTLVIARNGRFIRSAKGDPFVWHWLFWDNGRKVAYESGPLHFALSCSLMSLATGKTLSSYDCFHRVPDVAPDWLKTLEN